MSDTDRISGHTKLVGLIGSPVSHSMSPKMHNASFAQMGVDAVYLAFDVTNESLAEVVPALTKLGLLGYNVTMPNKMPILSYLDELSDAARLMGAVNTVKIEDGKTIGHNTDGAGFMRNLAEHGFDCKGKHMVLAGAGGAGSAIYVQAALDGMATVDVFNKVDPFYEKAEKRVADVREQTGSNVQLHDLDDRELLAKTLETADVVVNATKVGMKPMDDQCVFDIDTIPQTAYVADTVYNPLETKLIVETKARGNKVVPGLGMMLWQGAIAEKIWLDRDMDIDYIKDLLFS
jgi:shikimate dehydrogenase